MAHNLETLFTNSNDRTLVRPMSRKETEDFASILMMQRQPESRAAFAICKGKDLPQTPAFANEFSGVLAILAKRLEILTPEFEYDPLTVLFLAMLCDRPGKCVMWAFTLAKATKEMGVTITPDVLAQDCIPWGVPTEARQHQLWDDQKNLKTDDGLEHDNYIDTQEAWAWAN